MRIPRGALRAAADVTWRLRLQPTPPGWLDMALAMPIMDTTRARTRLGWNPGVSASDAFPELMDGIRRPDGYPTPPLDPKSSGPLRFREFATEVGERP